MKWGSSATGADGMSSGCGLCGSVWPAVWTMGVGSADGATDSDHGHTGSGRWEMQGDLAQRSAQMQEMRADSERDLAVGRSDLPLFALETPPL